MQKRLMPVILNSFLCVWLATPILEGAPPYWARAVIRPSLVELKPGEQQQFKVVMLATRLTAVHLAPEVKWSVNNVEGGNEQLGWVDETGNYRAPDTMPTPSEIHICAEVKEATNPNLFATVLMDRPDPSYKLLWQWSVPADNSPHLDKPHGIALDSNGNLLIADEGASRVLRFSPRGNFLGDVGRGKGSSPGQFTKPRCVTVDRAGQIFVSDSKGDRPRMQIFTPEGKFSRIFAEKGTGPGMILRAHGMAFDRDERLFAVDVDNMRVNIYSHDGDFLSTWGKDGRRLGDFNAPHGLVIDPSGDVFVSSYYGPTQKFDAQGNFVTVFGHGDPPNGPVYFHSMTGDHWGNLYLMVRNKGGYGGAIQRRTGKPALSIVKYNNNGDYITGWSLANTEHKETSAVVDADGRVYALFEGNVAMGVQVFGPQ